MTRKNIKNRQLNRKRGFTLVESLVAIAILATSLAASMTIVQKGLRTTFNSRDQITAFYLAQDAIEQIRSIRDTNKLLGKTSSNFVDGDYWLSGIKSQCVSPNGLAHCIIDDFNNAGEYSFGVDVCDVGPPTNPCEGILLQYGPATGQYGYGNGYPGGTVVSRFTRDIYIVSPFMADADEAEVVVTISWSDFGGAKSVTLTEHLRNL